MPGDIGIDVVIDENLPEGIPVGRMADHAFGRISWFDKGLGMAEDKDMTDTPGLGILQILFQPALLRCTEPVHSVLGGSICFIIPAVVYGDEVGVAPIKGVDRTGVFGGDKVQGVRTCRLGKLLIENDNRILSGWYSTRH